MLRDVGVVADDDHHRRRAFLSGGCSFDLFESLFPFARQGEQRILRLAVNDFRLRLAAGEFSPAFQLARDVIPELEILRVRPAGVIDRRQARNFGDAAFDSVDETEIADNPGKGRAFRVAAAVDVKRRGGKVDAKRDATSGVDFVEARDPDGGLLEGCLFFGGKRCVFADGGGR